MNDFYRAFLEMGHRLAADYALPWELPCDTAGKVPRHLRWDLAKARGLPPPPVWLSNFGPYRSATESLNRIRAARGQHPVLPGVMPAEWQDFLKAAVLNEVFVKQNKPYTAERSCAIPLRILAMCADGLAPWDLTGDAVQLAYNVALAIGESGKTGLDLAMAVRILIDGQHLADRSPLAGSCKPYASEDALRAQARVDRHRAKLRRYHHVDTMRTELSQRKGASRLPEERAFWELVRIVFTETPRSLADAVRFSQMKLAIVSGFRAGENVVVPADWQRWREYMDPQGRPAGERGGISRSLMIRHFAEKQSEDEGVDGIVLHETAQHVPPMFEQLVLEALGTAERLTEPLRRRLRRQTETGRLLPEFEPAALVPAWDLFNRVSGAMRLAEEPPPEVLTVEYRSGHDLAVLDKIRAHQIARLSESGINRSIGKYWGRHASQGSIVLRNWRGDALMDRVPDWRWVFLRVGEVEDFIRRELPTKLPDVEPFRLADGSRLYPFDLLFLQPLNDRIESQDRGVLDVGRYFAVGRASVYQLQNHLGGGEDNLFSRYGETEEDRGLKLVNHSLRHLQNAELFRLGVADTIITKRFNRRGVAQSYEYDHRSLAEDLAAIDLPPQAAERMGPRAQEALRMIMSGKVAGPIVDEFRRIQRELGDDVAFGYLDAEADGLHVTPYGFCLNSFAVDPCPKHLECFNGCRHLARSVVPEEVRALERLQERMRRVIDKIEATPEEARNIGWQNQLRHARTRLANIGTALETRPGERPFPDGPDLFRSVEAKAGTTILDAPARPIRRAE